jgi:hypothetical protein
MTRQRYGEQHEVDSDWGCWSCGHAEGFVTSTARDEDGNKIRRRKCGKCGDVWITEERRLAKGTRWFDRAWSQVEGQRLRREGHSHRCQYCGGRWQVGHWRSHVANSARHRAWKAQRAAQKLDYNREDSRWRYRADPVHRRAQIEAATRRKRAVRARDRAA